MTQNTKAAQSNPMLLRWSVIVAIAAIALFGSYRFAQARGNSPQAAGVVAAANGVSSGAGTGAGARAGGCCGAGGSTASGAAGATGAGGCCGSGAAKNAPATSKKADVAGSVQKISVDVSKGYYDPSTIELKAGVPAEITFSQSSGCTGQVISSDLGFSADLSQGPATIKLPALSAGTYSFSCGMQMVFGSIVVK